MNINLDYLQHQRKKKGLSQEALGKLIGYKSKNAWQRVEKGKVQLQSRYLKQLIEILDLDLDMLYID